MRNNAKRQRERNAQPHKKLKDKHLHSNWKVSYYHILVGAIASFIIWLLIKDVHKRLKFTDINSSTIVPPFKTICEQAGYDAEQLYALYELSVIHNQTEDEICMEGYSRHYFNQFVSDKLHPDRPVPDVRHHLCKTKQYSARLPTVSVIICFRNEAFSALIRTIHSVINRTPSEILQEIILIDDSSTFDDLKTNLEDHLSQEYYKKVSLLRNNEWQGLIISRIKGSRKAVGEVLMFLDSHCEVNIGWIEPLLARIQLNRRVIVAPIVDSIDTYTMVYDSVPYLMGGFSWDLFFRWEPIPLHVRKKLPDLSGPVESPAISGGLFAINREYFKELGEYDPELKIWGGENMEISFKVWQCGGKIEIVPCSRVGHIYRPKQPNTHKNNLNVKRNLLRVAHTWMDDYKKYLYTSRPEVRGMDYGDVADRLKLRQQLNCNSFRWYLQTVYPHQNLPDDLQFKEREENREKLIRKTYLKHFEHKVTRTGKILHVQSGLCLGYKHDPDKNEIVLIHCGNMYTLNLHETDQHDFRPIGTSYCLNIPLAKYHLQFQSCTYKVHQKFIWRAKETITQLMNPGTGKCLKPESDTEDARIILAYCSEDKNLYFVMIQ